MRKTAKVVAILALLIGCAVLLTGIANAQTSNVWSSAGQMVQPRTGAAAVVLSDGKILIAGGTDGNGIPLASTEVFDPATGQFSEGATMTVPRASHAAIVLASGDVLVTGGLTSGGGYSDTAEIFNAQTQSWTLLETSLGSGLAGHAMASLPDGNVVIVGGESTTGPVLTLVLFKTSDNSISPIGSLMTGRTNAVAAATPDGRVLIAGGTDINGAVLSSTEIFVYNADTMSGTVSAGPNMTFPRTNATATTTYDGVAVIGGSNGSVDIGSAEIFSQWTNAFRVVSGATPRSSHIAAFLPKNGSILAIGGTGGTAVDLLQPWVNNLAGAFMGGTPSVSDHNGGIAAPGNLGNLLVAGGTGASLIPIVSTGGHRSRSKPFIAFLQRCDHLARREAIAFFLRQRTGCLGPNLRARGRRRRDNARAEGGGEKTSTAEQRMRWSVFHEIGTGTTRAAPLATRPTSPSAWNAVVGLNMRSGSQLLVRSKL